MSAVALCGGLTAAGKPAQRGYDAPEVIAEHVNEDGSTTSVYDDGSSFTFEAPTLTELALSDFSTMAVRSRDWSATYSVSITSQYFHHDGGQIKLVVGPISDCGIDQTVYLQVATSWGGYTQTGKQSVPCQGGTLTWTSPEGNKKFELQDPNTNDQYFPHDVSGTVYWND